MKFKLNDKVMVYGFKASIRYVGSSVHQKFVYDNVDCLIGIEYESGAYGTCDGKFKGVNLFKCKENYGAFVKPNRVLPYDKVISAAICIQKYVRGYMCRKNFNEQIAFEFWNQLENFEEKETLSNNRDVGNPVEKNIELQLGNEILRELNEKENFDEDEDKFEYDLKDNSSRKSNSDLFRPKDILFYKASSLLNDIRSTFQASSLDKSSMNRFSNLSANRRSHGKKSLSLISTPEGRSKSITLILTEEISCTYTGPHLVWPITRQFALSLVDHYRDNLNVLLPRRYAFEILIQMEDYYKRNVKGAVIEVNVPKKNDSRFILVGDTHGQLNDVMWLFYKFGPPSPSNVYLFNGDIADRGEYAVEIFLILFSFKLVHPESVYINRGNHESSDMNEVYGFAQEVRQKYGGVLYQTFQSIFHHLPLCVVLEKRVLVIHGGLFRKDNVTLKQIDSINRKRDCPANPTTFEDLLMFDSLWSDPQQEEGRGFSSRGVDCISFGPDVTDKFLRDNNLEVCIRSHQVPSNLRGFEPMHDGRCVTIFSASNYCGTTGNYGGVILFESDMSFEIQEYMAPSMNEIKELYNETHIATLKVLSQSKIKDVESKILLKHRRRARSRMERDILKKMCKMICENKQELWWYYFNQDDKNTSSIPPKVWREGCAAILGDKLPWCYLMKKLKVLKKNECEINYNNFLSRFKVEFKTPNCKHINWRKQCIQRLFESILAADLSLKETLMVFDRNCDGAVSFREFNELLNELDIGLSEPQVKILMRIITSSCYMRGEQSESNANSKNDRLQSTTSFNRMDAAEFLGRFKVIYSNQAKLNDNVESWIVSALTSIGKAILADKAETAVRHYEELDSYSLTYDLTSTIRSRRRSSAIKAVALFQKFKDFNEEGDGYLSYSDFVTSIKRLPIDQISDELGFQLTDSHLLQIAEAIDITGSRKINYLEFLNAFYVVDSSSQNNVAEELWGQICTTLFQHRSTTRRALHKFDTDLTGKIDLNHFRDVLTTLNTVLARTEAPFTEEQIESLVNFLDLDNEGMLEYEELLDSFHAVDTLMQNNCEFGDE